MPVRKLEAVFEAGVLRPLQPLLLPEHHRVMVTIDDNASVAAAEFNHSMPSRHGWGPMDMYIGQWVALDGGTLISHRPQCRSCAG